MARSENLIGKRFGKLMVLDKQNVNKKILWECRCECGSTLLIRTSRLIGADKHRDKCIDCTGILWNKNEIDYLVENYKLIETVEIANNIKRTIKAITSKAKKLGLRKDVSLISNRIIKSNKLRTRDINIDSLIKIASKFITKREFRESDNYAYRRAKEIGFDLICPHIMDISYSLPQCILYEILYELLKSTIYMNDRKIIKPYELDLYIPSYNIAFEYDGSYWHANESAKENDKKKENLCIISGINLFRIKEKSKNYVVDIKNQLIEILDDLNLLTNKKISRKEILDIRIDSDFIRDKHHMIFFSYKSLHEFTKENYSLYRKLKKYNLVEKYCSHMEYDLPSNMKPPYIKI
jgi:hypothetical protein